MFYALTSVHTLTLEAYDFRREEKNYTVYFYGIVFKSFNANIFPFDTFEQGIKGKHSVLYLLY